MPNPLINGEFVHENDSNDHEQNIPVWQYIEFPHVLPKLDQLGCRTNCSQHVLRRMTYESLGNVSFKP